MSIIAWFDEKAAVWCKDHKPENGEYEGELTPVLSSDVWALDVSPCKVCKKWPHEEETR